MTAETVSRSSHSSVPHSAHDRQPPLIARSATRSVRSARGTNPRWQQYEPRAQPSRRDFQPRRRDKRMCACLKATHAEARRRRAGCPTMATRPFCLVGCGPAETPPRSCYACVAVGCSSIWSLILLRRSARTRFAVAVAGSTSPVTAQSRTEPGPPPVETPREGQPVRTEEQEVAAGQTEKTPVVVLSTVIFAVAALVLIALGAVALRVLARLNHGGAYLPADTSLLEGDTFSGGSGPTRPGSAPEKITAALPPVEPESESEDRPVTAATTTAATEASAAWKHGLVVTRRRRRVRLERS